MVNDNKYTTFDMFKDALPKYGNIDLTKEEHRVQLIHDLFEGLPYGVPFTIPTKQHKRAMAHLMIDMGLDERVVLRYTNLSPKTYARIVNERENA